MAALRPNTRSNGTFSFGSSKLSIFIVTVMRYFIVCTSNLRPLELLTPKASAFRSHNDYGSQSALDVLRRSEARMGARCQEHGTFPLVFSKLNWRNGSGDIYWIF